MRKKNIRIFLMGMVCLLLFQQTILVEAEEYWPNGPQIEGGSAVVMEASTGTVLYGKNEHEKLYPASITKILTTLLALEHTKLEEKVTFSHDSVHKIERDSTHIFRDVGEIMTMEQCLYAVMLGSANDCAYAVAEHTGKGYDNFIVMMNQKAQELGCENSHFMNPHGLPHQDHYTTAYDMALISKAALENETFRMITGTDRYTIPFTNKHPNEETPIVNHHKMLTNYKGERAYLYEYCIGGKTGFTELARNTLVTFAEKDDMTLICVVMKENSVSQYTDTRKLLDYCFENFTMWNVSQNQEEYLVEGTANHEIFGSTASFVDLDRSSKIVLPNNVPFEKASYKLVEKKQQEDVVASWEYSYGGRVVGSADIKVTNVQIEKYDFHEVPKEIGKDSGEKGWLSSFKSLELNVHYIVLGILLFVVIFLVIMIFFYIHRNFYILRHKFQSKRRRRNRFKIIKPGKHSKWKRRF